MHRLREHRQEEHGARGKQALSYREHGLWREHRLGEVNGRTGCGVCRLSGVRARRAQVREAQAGGKSG